MGFLGRGAFDYLLANDTVLSILVKDHRHRVLEADVRVLLSQLPPIPPGSKVVIQEMPTSSKLLDDVTVLGFVCMLGLLIGFVVAWFS